VRWSIWHFHPINDVCLLAILCRFLLVSLNIDSILGEVTVRQRRKKLEEMTQGNGLSDAYTETLTRLKTQKGNKPVLGLKALMWVLYSERPLRTGELCHALGVEMGSTDLDLENFPTLRTILASSLGLLAVEASSSTVRLVHFTLQEHLLGDPTLFSSPHSTIAEVCLTYLNFGCIRDLSPTLFSAPPTLPLLEYASCYWGAHARREMTENVKILALRLLNGFDGHISAQLMLLRYSRDSNSGPFFNGTRGPGGFTGLHAVAFFGIAAAVAPILEMKEWDVNATDGLGSTAIAWAAGNGHEGVVKALLEREGVNPDQTDARSGRTSLSRAAGSGHEGIVKMLLTREDVDPDKADIEYGRTPLSWAVEHGHEGVVKCLLERGDVNPDQADSMYGRTPLSWAARHGRDGVARLLLEREDVNPNRADTLLGQMPLSRAAEFGHEGVVKMLLERDDVDPDQADSEYGRTPLSWAAEFGHEVVVKMLLERDGVNPDRADSKYGRTPLSLAAGGGHEGVVKMLLERDDVSPDQVDTSYGRTPSSWAAESGYKRVAKILLERNNARTGIPRDRNQPPPSSALPAGHDRVVRIISERGNVNSDTPGCRSQTLPTLSSRCGGERITRTHLHDDRPNTDIADPDALEQVFDCKDPVSKSADSAISSTQPSNPPPPLSTWSLKSWYSPRNTGPHPNNTLSTLPVGVNRYLAITSFVCVLALFIHIIPPLLPDRFPFRK